MTGELNDRPMVMISNLAQKKTIHWVSVKLVGKASNRDGFGAKVSVKAGGKTSTQWQDGKSGYLSFSSLPLYFGLGRSAAIESIEVTWPSGARQEVKTGLETNRQIEIREP